MPGMSLIVAVRIIVVAFRGAVLERIARVLAQWVVRGEVLERPGILDGVFDRSPGEGNPFRPGVCYIRPEPIS